MTPLGIESAIFRLVAHWRKKLRHRVPYVCIGDNKIIPFYSVADFV